MDMIKELLIGVAAAIIATLIQNGVPIPRMLTWIGAKLLDGEDRTLLYGEWQMVIRDLEGEKSPTWLALGFLFTGLRRRGQIILRCIGIWAMTCLRLGVTQQQLNKLLVDDIGRIIEAAKAGQIELKDFKTVRLGEGKELCWLVTSGKVPMSTARQRGEWWNKDFWIPREGGGWPSGPRSVRAFQELQKNA